MFQFASAMGVELESLARILSVQWRIEDSIDNLDVEFGSVPRLTQAPAGSSLTYLNRC